MPPTPVLPHPSEALLAADSFRVRGTPGHAEVRGWPRHIARFTAAVTDSGATEALRRTLPAFISEATARINEYGEGFPRLECWRTPETGELRLALSVRPLPALADTLHVVPTRGVTLQHATRKGPNLHELTALNTLLGAEALLVTPAGTLSEGASTSLLWWEAGTLCVSAHAERVPSVTETLLLDAARAAGYPTAARELTEAMLHTHEVWGVNALHGIRPVRLVRGEPVPDTRGLSERAHGERAPHEGQASGERHSSGTLQQFRGFLEQSWCAVGSVHQSVRSH